MPSTFWKSISARVQSLGLLAIVLGGLGPSAAAAADAERLRPGDYRPDRLLLLPRPGHETSLRKFHLERGARVHRDFPGLAKISVIEIPPGSDALALAEAYRRSGHVEAAEPDIRLRPALEPNDPHYLAGNQWGLHNTGQLGGLPDADMDAPEAWDRFNAASNIVIAVIDSGARLSHEDLAGNFWVNPGEIPGNFIDDDGNGLVDDVHGINAIANNGLPLDDLGHGTHVCGIIGAVGNNGLGICGVAWRARIMPCKFLSQTDGSASDLIQCIDYARANGAHVLNCSFTTAIYSSILSNAFWSVRNSGILVAAAAGNDGTDNDLRPIYPASFQIDNIVAVTATTRSDAFSGYNYGATTVHLAAPGSSIYSTYYTSDSSYEWLNGTSMAAPMVAGALALMRAHYPQMSPPQLIARLLESVDPLPSLVGRCRTGGRLNLNKAVGPRDYVPKAVPFAWVPTNGMAPHVLANDGISAPIALPFPWEFFGRTYSHLFVGANGLLGFVTNNLNSPDETDFPSVSGPNAALYPYWDDLNPAAGGMIWTGTLGASPFRRFVASWVGVPHAITEGGETPLTFQAILHETGEIAFQYLDVQTGHPALVRGKSAAIGVEDETGMLASRYGYHGDPAALTNFQAVVFAPEGSPTVAPVLSLTPAAPGSVELHLSAQPGQPVVLSRLPDLQLAVPVETNTVPASGVLTITAPATEGHQFYKAQILRP